MNHGYPKIGLCFRISIIHLRISLNHKKIMHMPKGYNVKMNYGYPKIDLWISLNQIIYGYPKIELWVSKNRIMDILNSRLFLDILKYI